MTILEPPARHQCHPPKHRPREEWATVKAPPGWIKKGSAGRVPIPTQHRPGTVWVCACGRGWLKRQSTHYGANRNIGWVEGSWSPVPWYAFRIRRRIREHEQRCAYERDKAIVDSYVLPEPGATLYVDQVASVRWVDDSLDHDRPKTGPERIREAIDRDRGGPPPPPPPQGWA